MHGHGIFHVYSHIYARKLRELQHYRSGEAQRPPGLSQNSMPRSGLSLRWCFTFAALVVCLRTLLVSKVSIEGSWRGLSDPDQEVHSQAFDAVHRVSAPCVISLILDGDHLDDLLNICQCCLSLPSSLPNASLWDPVAASASRDLACASSGVPRNGEQQSPALQSASSYSSCSPNCGCSALSCCRVDNRTVVGPKDAAFCVEPVSRHGDGEGERTADGADAPLMWADERSIAESLAIAIVDHLYRRMIEQEYDKPETRGCQPPRPSASQSIGLSRCRDKVRSQHEDPRSPRNKHHEPRDERMTRRARPQLDVLVKAHVQLGLTAELG